jgi:FimV-like protein
MKMLEPIKIAGIYLQTHPVVHYMIITAILIVTLLLVVSMRKKNEAATNAGPEVSHNDIQAIAGDDVIATQLDLAKAYIEMNQKQTAHTILKQALKQGNASQQQEAKQLLEKI